MLVDQHKPDFIMVTFSILLSLISYSARIDSDHHEKGLPVEEMPSRNRQQYGFIFHNLSPKLFAKPSCHAMFEERANYQVVPVDVRHLDLLTFFNLKVCYHKIELPFDEAGVAAFKPEHDRIQNFVNTHKIVLVDKFASISLIQNRITFSNKLQELVDSLPADLRETFGVPRMTAFSNTKPLTMETIADIK